jgi:hypothetical protein
MESKFHRWWLFSCVAALLLASWVGGFSVAVTAVFVVIYLTGVTLVGPDDEADVGLSAQEPGRETGTAAAVHAPEPVPLLEAEPVHLVEADPEPENFDDDAVPYPDDGDEREPVAPVIVEPAAEAAETDTAVVVVESAAPLDTAVVVAASEDVDTTAVVEIIESDDAQQTEALIVEEPAAGSEQSADRA